MCGLHTSTLNCSRSIISIQLELVINWGQCCTNECWAQTEVAGACDPVCTRLPTPQHQWVGSAKVGDQ